MGKLILTTCLLIAFLIASCWTPMEPIKETKETIEMRELTPSEKEVTGAANTFGINLLAKLSELDDEKENIFISPLSISIALGMALHGAEGETQEEMKQVLEFHNMPIGDINEAYRGLLDLLPYIDPDVELLIANSMWYRIGFPVLDSYIETNKKYFDAEVDALDFSLPEASDIMNNWVNEKTKGLIEDIVPEEIDPLTVMYLINAVYFKGDWAIQFDKEDTRDADFRLEDGSTIPVKMMHQKDSFRVSLSYQDVSVIDLPYSDGHYSMTIVLPPQNVSIHELTGSMTSEKWQTWLGKLPDEPREIDVYIPRFTLEYEKSLVDVLQALGMRRAFSPALAEFDGIYDREKIGGENLYISNVMHKTFVDVNEEGTEAAAATSVEFGVTSAPPAFRADSPFLMAIRESSSDTILFIGKVYKPMSE